jgi:thiol-disulfide isomerase/thioredoxin
VSRVESREPDANSRAAPKSDGGGSSWGLIALIVVAAGALVVMQMRRPRVDDSQPSLPLPPLDAAGWLNTDRPLTAADLRGKIVVVDFFASWCGPCAQELPRLVEFSRRYRGQGVQVVGLSNEPPAKLAAIQQFITRVPGVDWPVAYGAVLAGEMLGIEWLPTYVLYDRTGQSVWTGGSVERLEDAVVALLAGESS